MSESIPDSSGNCGEWKKELGISLFLIIAVSLVFFPLFHAEFINTDDFEYVKSNIYVRNGFTWRNFVWAFQHGYAANWHPLTWFSHTLDCQVFGLQPRWHHAVNIAFHAANSVLLFLVLRGLTGRRWESGMVAVFFAVHPMHVESVAWISERKDLLSTFFGLLCLGAYARYARAREKAGSASSSPFSASRIWYGAALVLFGFSLMSKAMLVTLPFVFLLMDYWPLKRWRLDRLRPLILEKIPFVALSGLCCALTLRAQKAAMIPVAAFSVWKRFENASVAYVRYLRKAIWPTDLSFFYPHPTAWRWSTIAGAVLVLAVISLAAVWLRRSRGYLFVGWFWFVGMMVPAIGLVQVGAQSMADRYSYVPFVGLFLLLAWGAGELLAGARLKALAFGAALLWAASLACVAHLRVEYWHDSLRLYDQAFSLYPDDYTVNLSLGGALLDKGNLKAGDFHLRRALRELPEDPTTLWNLGHSCSRQNKWAEAIEWYRQAIAIKPDFAAAYCDLGLSAGMAGRYEEASEAFNAALRLRPDYTEAHLYFGNMLTLIGKAVEAIPHYEAVLALEPRSAEGHYFLGMSLAKQRNEAGAAREFRAALAERADYVAAANDLAWILATSRDPPLRDVPEAIRIAEKVCEQSHGKQASFLDTLGVAYAAGARFPDAIKTTKAARKVAEDAKQVAVVEEMNKRLKLYREGKPYEP